MSSWKHPDADGRESPYLPGSSTARLIERDGDIDRRMRGAPAGHWPAVPVRSAQQIAEEQRFWQTGGR